MNIEHFGKLTAPKRDTHAGISLAVCLDVLNKSPKELADHLQVSRQQLHRMKETKKINDSRVQELADYFEMTVDEFLSLPHHVISFSLETYFRQSISYLSQKGITKQEADELVDGMAKILGIIKLIEAR
jgi:plasmid maintenance system antidote protein VapI